MMRIRSYRIIFPILTLHFLAIPLLVWWVLGLYEHSMWEAQEKLGRTFLQRVQDEIAVHQMATRDSLQIQKTIDHMYASHSFTALTVYDDDGRRVAFKGDDAGTGMRLEDVTRMEVGPQKDVMKVTHWVRNDPPCQPCHEKSKAYIGVIEGAMPLSRSIRVFGFSRIQVFLATAIASVLIFAIVTLFNFFSIIRPVQRIMDGMRKVKEGDLSARIALDRPDEMGQMARNFNEVVSSLRIAREELEQRHQEDMTRAEQLATVGEIASGLAHEVKNPLAGISSALEVVLSDPEPLPMHRDVLIQIQGEIHRISSIFSQLLDYARPRRGHPDWVDLNIVVADLKAIFTPQCLKKRAAFQVEGDAAWTGRIFLDPDALKQVLFNLLQNALQAVRPGGTIRLDVKNAGEDRIEFRVSDDGEGMDEATRARIFQPFFTTKSGGTGLGLAIVARLAREMGGEIAVESEPGRGSVFSVTLPREHRHEDPHRG